MDASQPAPSFPALEELIDLPVLPLRLTAVAREPIHLPLHAASSIRGAFGGALKALVCVEPRRPRCEGCPQEFRCAYPALFEPRARPDQPGTDGFRDLPRPYVLRTDASGTIPAGEALVWEATLIGEAIAALPYFALGWKAMGETGIGWAHGRGCGRFNLVTIQPLDLEGEPSETVYDRSTNRLMMPESVVTAEALDQWAGAHSPAEGAAGVRVRFLTPTLIKRGGVPQPVPEFPVLWRAVQLRLSTLRLAHGAGRPRVDFPASLRAAEGIRLERWDSRTVAWERYSRRQGQRVPMGGFVGCARYSGDLAPFLPALRLGALVGVGDNCTFGQGWYGLEAGLCEEEDSNHHGDTENTERKPAGE